MEVHVVLHFRSVMEVHGSFRPLDEETVLDGGFDVRWRRLLRSISDSYISRLQSARSLAPHPTPPHPTSAGLRAGRYCLDAPHRSPRCLELVAPADPVMDRPRPSAPEDPGSGGPPPLLIMLGFFFLTFNSAMAVYRSQGDPQSVAFVTFSYADLVLLFFCLRSYEREPAGYGSRRKWLKGAVWVLTTLLTLAFSYKVAEVMPPVVAVLVWAMAAATVVGGFYAFFVHESKPSTTSEPQNITDSAV